MDRSTAWYAVGSTVHSGVPAPELVRIQDHSIHIEAFTCADVDLWAKWLKLPKPWIISGSYSTVQFYSHGGGWLGADLISISCDKPSEVDKMKEEMAHGNDRESVAA